MDRSQVVRATAVGPRARQELQRHVSILRETSCERVTVGRAAHLRRRTEGQAGGDLAIHPHVELRRGVQDARLVQAHTVRIQKLHVQIALRVQPHAIDNLPGERLRQIRGREEHLRLRPQRRPRPEQREAIQAEAVQLEAIRPAHREACVATEGEDLRAAHVDLHGRTGNCHQHLASGAFRECHRAANLNEAGYLDRD